MTTGKALNGKPYAGNPHVRFDEGEVASCTAEASLRRVHCRRQPEGRASVCAATPRRGSLLYKMEMTRRGFMRGALAAGAYGVAGRDFGFAATADAAALPLPTPAHLKWADMELGMFYHYDIPIFGGGRAPDPKRYNPAKLDTDQWMEAAKAYGAKYVVLTAKHGAGFMQWQSEIYP